MASTQTMLENSPLDSAQLYHACRSEDQAVRSQAYQSLWTYLYRIALKIVYDQPDAPAFAQDCAQAALIRVHERIDECQGPASFRAWARQITSHLAIDALRRQKRLNPLDDGHDDDQSTTQPLPAAGPGPETVALTGIQLDQLETLLNQAPISQRSRRVVLGRYLNDEPDEILAQTESQLAEEAILPSHIQVTRSKNLSKLRQWEPLRAYLDQTA
jgi:RNA polymerase sigma factor (sigma-70 family)